MYLDSDTLTRNEKDILLIYIKTGCDAISKKLRLMVHKFKTWMQENVSVEIYRDILFTIPGTIRKEVPMLQDRWEEIKMAYHTECSVILSDYYTWFNCSVLRAVLEDAKTLTHKDPKEILLILQSYTEEVHRFCRRNIFECPPPSDLDVSKSFVLIVEKYQVLDEKTFTAEEIEIFKATLIGTLDIDITTLKICTLSEIRGSGHYTQWRPPLLESNTKPYVLCCCKSWSSVCIISLSLP